MFLRTEGYKKKKNVRKLSSQRLVWDFFFFFFFYGYEITQYNHQNDIMIYNHEYMYWKSVRGKLNYFIKKKFLFCICNNKTFSYKKIKIIRVRNAMLFERNYRQIIDRFIVDH